MLTINDVIDVTTEKLAERERGKLVLKLAKDFFKYPYVVNGVPPINYIPITRFISILSKELIGIWPESNRLRCYNQKYFSKFMEFANIYKKEIGKPKLEIDYS